LRQRRIVPAAAGQLRPARRRTVADQVQLSVRAVGGREKGERRKEKGERRKEKGDKGYLSSAFSLLSSSNQPGSRPRFHGGPPRNEALIPAPCSKGGRRAAAGGFASRTPDRAQRGPGRDSPSPPAPLPPGERGER